jgi:hypothetical protein
VNVWEEKTEKFLRKSLMGRKVAPGDLWVATIAVNWDRYLRDNSENNKKTRVGQASCRSRDLTIICAVKVKVKSTTTRGLRR